MAIDFGNFSNSLKKIGTGMMDNVNFYARAKMALHNSGMGCCGGGMSVWNQNGCCTGGMRYPGASIYGGGYAGGAYSTCDNFTLNAAYMQGANLFNAYFAQQMQQASSIIDTSSLQETDNQTAPAVTADTDTTLGQAFDTSANQCTEFGFAKSAMEAESDTSTKQQIYKQSTETLGKSFLMYMDKNSGNSDGYISLEEFLNHETKSMSAAQKAQMLSFIQQAFSSLDQNGDGKVDFKELSAMIAAYDANTDGTISNEEFSGAGEKLMSGSLTQNLKASYQRMFGKTSS